MVDISSWGLPVALILLVGVGITAVWIGGLPLRGAVPFAAGRALLQLGLVSLAITAVLVHVLLACVFALVMLGVAVFTTTRRCQIGRGWPWVLAAMASGIAVVLAVIFLSGAAPLSGASIVPIAGIVTGGAMNANTLTCRRSFDTLREEWGQVEAGLALGFAPPDAVREVVHRSIPEALVPALDQTRTVGLVTLPGTFVGVLLGGGTPLQAGAAQVLTLVGILTAQCITVVLVERFVCAGRVLPADLRLTRAHAWA